MVSMILLLVIISIMIFSFLNIPFLSSIGRYTVNMMLGLYSPFFYLFIIYLLLKKKLKEKKYFPNWLKLNKITYWIVAISIVFVATSTRYYQSKLGFADTGSKPWNVISNWFDWFTVNQTANGWNPKNINGGFIGVFLYALIASILSGVGAFTVALMTLVISVLSIIIISSVSFHKNIESNKKRVLENKEIKNMNNFNAKKMSNSENLKKSSIKIRRPIKKKDENKLLPFDDPFTN